MFTKNKRWINIFLAILIFCGILFIVPGVNASAGSEPQAAPSEQPQGTAYENPQKVSEVTGLRTEYSNTYLMNNGQYECEVHAAPINYKDSEGKFQEIDNSITDATGKEGYKYTNTADSWHAYFAKNISQENAVSVEKDGYAVSFNLEDPSVQSEVQKSSIMDKSASEFDGQLAGDDSSVVYKDIYKNVDAAYTVMTQGLKENIIFRDKNVPDKYTYDIELKGLELVQKDGNAYFENSAGEEIFSLNPMFMEDSKGQDSYKVGCDIEKSDKGYALTVTADTNFLNDPNTVFPVIIDPTVTVQGTANTYDTYVCTAHPTYNYNYGSSDPIGTAYTKLRTGKDDPVNDYGVRRTYIRFTRPGLPSGATVLSSFMRLYKDSSAGAINITAYRVTASWNSSTITWNNKPGYTGDYNSSLAIDLGNSWYQMNVSHWIQAFYSGTSDYGFCIRDSNESDVNVWATWRSSDYSGSTYDPILEINYATTSPVNTSTVMLLSEERFRATHPDSGNLETSWLLAAAMAFRNTYNLQLTPGTCYDGSGFPGASCTTGDANYCTFGDSPNCGQNCNDHHKNAGRNLTLAKNLGLYGHDLQLFFVGHLLETCNDAGTIHTGADYGLTDQVNNNWAYSEISTIYDYFWNIRTIQHELSHCYGCNEGSCSAQPCIMKGSFNGEAIVHYDNIWCNNCQSTFNEYLH